MNKCKKCKFYIHTITLGRLDKPVWHCRYGFTPTKDCKRMGEYNDEIVERGLGEYMHCNQDRCPRHEECWRYELGKMCNGIASFYMPDKDEDLSKCEYFINKENFKIK